MYLFPVKHARHTGLAFIGEDARTAYLLPVKDARHSTSFCSGEHEVKVLVFSRLRKSEVLVVTGERDVNVLVFSGGREIKVPVFIGLYTNQKS